MQTVFSLKVFSKSDKSYKSYERKLFFPLVDNIHCLNVGFKEWSEFGIFGNIHAGITLEYNEATQWLCFENFTNENLQVVTEFMLKEGWELSDD